MPQAWRWSRGGDALEPIAIEAPTPGPGRVRVAVEAAAIDQRSGARERVPGVAAVGTVTAVGAAADEWLGARVLVPAVQACGECDRCRRGGPARCADGGRLGATAPGTAATHITAMARWLVRLDGALALPGAVTAALGGELAFAYTLYARAGVGPRDPAVVVGGDPLARLVAEVLLAKGVAPVIATGDAAVLAAIGDRAAVAAPHTAAIEAAVADLGARPRRVIVTDLGHLELALRVAGPRGTVVAAAGGLTSDTPLAVALADEITVAGVLDGHPDLVPELAALAARGDLPLPSLVEVVPIAELAEHLGDRAVRRPATTLVAALPA